MVFEKQGIRKMRGVEDKRAKVKNTAEREYNVSRNDVDINGDETF